MTKIDTKTDVGSAVGGLAEIIDDYRRVRAFTEKLCAPLQTEDYVIQSMPDASPTRWHLAHVSWFFETFLLGPALPDYRPFHPLFAYLFNSYYNTIGPQFNRARRGLLSRPTVEEVYAYRRHVDQAMQALLESWDEEELDRWSALVTLGLNHEQQHQELILTDIKHALAQNPLYPAYLEGPEGQASDASPPLRWKAYPEGLRLIGHEEGEGFAFDNESPRHRVFLDAFELASRLITCGEYLAFMKDSGYRRPELWLSEGWATVRNEGWQSPLYWLNQDEHWRQMTLHGLRPLDPHEPVGHLSYYEADAYARWAGARLSGEAEWETAARDRPLQGNFAEDGYFQPKPLAAAMAASDPDAPRQMFGDLWEWTQSPYAAYPGFRPASGAIGEYNGKFMSNQMVLRGGSCATPRNHIRATYRNFFPPCARWQWTGIRLARNVQ